MPQSDKPAKPSRKRKAPAPKASGVQDPLADIDGEIIQKPKPKRRRKKDEEDEEEWAGDDVSTVKPKAKNARKKKATPAKPKNQGSKSRMQMVVEITEGKGSPRKKPISVSGSGSNLRLEEPRKKPEDQSGASAVLQPDGVPQNPKPAENEESSELSVLESDVEGNPGKKKGKDAKKFGAKEPSGSSSSKTAGSAKSRGKRRAVVESDEDDGEERGIRSSVGKVKGVDASEGSRSRHSTVGVVRSSLDAGLDSAKGKSREKVIHESSILSVQLTDTKSL